MQNITRIIRHFQYTNWPDHGVPPYATAFLAFRKKITTFELTRTGPLLVHCRYEIKYKWWRGYLLTSFDDYMYTYQINGFSTRIQNLSLCMNNFVDFIVTVLELDVREHTLPSTQSCVKRRTKRGSMCLALWQRWQNVGSIWFEL